MKFENQAAIVTGAGRGIVQAIAMRLAAEGARVACVGRTPEKARRVADELNSGLHRTYVSDLERGARNPSVGSLQKLARALQIPVAKLFEVPSNGDR